MAYPTAIAAQLHQRYLSEQLGNVLNADHVWGQFFGDGKPIWRRIAGNNTNHGNVLYLIVKLFVSGGQRKFLPTLWDYKDQVYRAYHSAPYIANILGISIPTVERAIFYCVGLGLIDYKVIRDPKGVPTRHFALNYDKLLSEIAKAVQKPHYSFLQMISSIRSSCSFHIYSSTLLKKDHIENPDQPAEAKPDLESEISALTSEPLSLQTRGEEKRQEKECMKNGCLIEKTAKQDLISSSFNCQDLNLSTQVARVDEIVNKNIKLKTDAIATAFRDQVLKFFVASFKVASRKIPKTKKVKSWMARHLPEGDRYFGEKRERPTQYKRRISKVESGVGQSDFENLEQLQACQQALTHYFVDKGYPLEIAAKDARWIIDDEKKGMRSVLVGKFKNNKPFELTEEWEIKLGTPYPILLNFVGEKIKFDKESRANYLSRAEKKLKGSKLYASVVWDECKADIKRQDPNIIQAIKLGQNVAASANIPRYISETFKPETSAEEAARTLAVIEELCLSLEESKIKHQHMLNNQGFDSSKMLEAVKQNTDKFYPDRVLQPENKHPIAETVEMPAIDYGNLTKAMPAAGAEDEVIKPRPAAEKKVKAKNIPPNPAAQAIIREALNPGESVKNYLIEIDSYLKRRHIQDIYSKGVKAAFENNLPVTKTELGAITGIDFDNITEEIKVNILQNLPKKTVAIDPNKGNNDIALKADGLLNNLKTRGEGMKIALANSFPVNFDDEGNPVAIDFIRLEGESSREAADRVMDKVTYKEPESTAIDPENPYAEGHGLAHQIYIPEAIEKGEGLSKKEINRIKEKLKSDSTKHGSVTYALKDQLDLNARRNKPGRAEDL